MCGLIKLEKGVAWRGCCLKRAWLEEGLVWKRLWLESLEEGVA